MKNIIFIFIGSLFFFPSVAFADLVLVQDSFTDTSGVDLENHTPIEIGNQWELLGSTGTERLEIQSNRLDHTGSLSDGVRVGAPFTQQTEDHYVQVDNPTIDSGDDTTAISVRTKDNNNMYSIHYVEGSGRLYKKVSGSWTALASSVSDAGITDGEIMWLEIGGATGSTISWGYGDRRAGTHTTLETLIDGSITGTGTTSICYGACIIAGNDMSSQITDDYLAVATDIADPTCTAWIDFGTINQRNIGGGVHSWANEDNASGSDDSDASASSDADAAAEDTHYLTATGATVDISATTVYGAQFRVERACSDAASEWCRDNEIKIIKGGTIGTRDKSFQSTNWPTSDTNQSYGSGASLWGETLTEADVESDDFGIAISATLSDLFSTVIAYVDNVQVKICYLEAPAGGAQINFITTY